MVLHQRLPKTRTVTTRPTRSTRKFQARVMQAEPVRKMRHAMAMARFRPKRSAVLPAGGVVGLGEGEGGGSHACRM